MTGLQVVHAVGVGYFVASKSVPGAWRLVNAAGCTCPAKGRRSCRHRRAVDRFVSAENEALRRPTAPVRTSMFVD